MMDLISLLVLITSVLIVTVISLGIIVKQVMPTYGERKEGCVR